MRSTIASLLRRHVDQYITVCRGSKLPTPRIVQEAVNVLVLTIFAFCRVTELWNQCFVIHVSHRKNSGFGSGPTGWLSSVIFVCSYAQSAKYAVNTSSPLS